MEHDYALIRAPKHTQALRIKKCFLIAVAFFFHLSMACAQLNNTVFFDSIQSSAEKGIFIGLRGTGYFRNTEYFNPVQVGATLFGIHTLPSVSLVPVQGITLQAGALVRNDFGRFGKQIIEPTFSIQYAYRHFTFTFGTLEGHLRHGLFEPLYDFERWIDRRVEQGVQLQYHLPEKVQSNTWIEWQQATYQGTQNKEAFWAGSTGYWRWLHKYKWYADIRWQGTAYHVGGQLDTTTLPSFSQFNGALGVRLGRQLVKDFNIYAELHYLGHSNTAKQAFMRETVGNAWMATMHSTLKKWQLQLNYWNATDWYTEQGGPMYRSQSIATGQPTFYASKRELLWCRLFYDIPWSEGFVLSLRAELVHDLPANRTEYGYGLYLNYRIGSKLYLF
jgi:hypothetical protein